MPSGLRLAAWSAASQRSRKAFSLMAARAYAVASSWRTRPSHPRAFARPCVAGIHVYASRVKLGFDRGHTCIQPSIVCFTISTSMNPSMTVRAESNHMRWMIWAAIA